MNCERLRDRLLAGDSPEAAELKAHAQNCESCGQLLSAPELTRVLSAPTEAARLEPAWHLVQAELAKDQGLLGRLKGLPTRGRALILGLLGAAIVFCEATLLTRADMHLLDLVDLLPLLLVSGLMIAIGIWVTLRPLQERALPSAALYAVIAASLALPVVLAFVHPTSDHPARELGATANFAGYAGACLAHGLGLTASAWLGFRVLDRTEFGAHFARLTAATTAALIGVTGLSMHCPIASSSHWLLGHAPIGFLALFAVLFAVRWQRKG